MRPDEAALRRDMEAGPFLLGQARGKWHLLEVVWPNALIAVSAAPRDGSPAEYVLRFDLSGYPGRAPTAGLWDVDRDQLLEGDLRPTGDGDVSLAFRDDWAQGRALYLPCDRVALDHGNWRSKYQLRAWRPDSNITHYLNIVYELLNSPAYKGTRRAVSSH